MAKKVTGKQSLSAVRLTQEAKEKLCVIAERKCTTLGIAASRIILHYATNNLDYEVPESYSPKPSRPSGHACESCGFGIADRRFYQVPAAS